MKRLILLRHASAASGAPDAARPLDARGRLEAERIAARVAALAPPPGALLSSPARRARETIEAVRRALDPAPGVRVEEALYLGSPRAILAVVGGLPPAVEGALVVGHNPGLEELARGLSGTRADAALRRALRGGLAPAALVAFELDVDDWATVEGAPARLVAFELP